MNGKRSSSDEFMLDESLIATLEQSLRQIRRDQQRLVARLNEIEAEANSLRQEIEARENGAEQMEQAIDGLMETMRSTGKRGRTVRPAFKSEDEFDLPPELKHASLINSVNRGQNPPTSGNPNDTGHGGSQMGSNFGAQHPPQASNYDNYGSQGYQNGGYRNNTVPFVSSNNPRSIPNVAPNIEPISHRFAERTITQSCTLLLREIQRPLHVNELYNLLVAGGMEFKGENPTISIAVSLSRNRRFRRVAPGTFDLVIRDASQAAS
jgi:hypothetical protein